LENAAAAGLLTTSKATFELSAINDSSASHFTAFLHAASWSSLIAAAHGTTASITLLGSSETSERAAIE
jgi:hypothetical protein